ncbi:MAG: universal stress protein [Nitrospirae bacterium]|nr:universal stress protein [Nitrospirota bacterium]
MAQVCPVSRLEKLLVAVDMSEFSEGAISEAISFAVKCSSKLYAVTVLEANPEYETIGLNAFEKEEEEAARYLESVKARAVKEGLNCEVVVHRGESVYQFIIDEAAEKKVDIIVMGKHGRKGLAKLLMGEVAAKVIGNAPCNVLIVPKAARIEYAKILMATDGSEHSDAAAAEAIGIAKRCGSRLLAVSVMHDETERAEATANVNKVVELARKEGIEAEALTPIGRSFDVIVETAGGRGVDLIVMGTYGKTGIRKMLMGSVTEKVVGNAVCAVLVVRAKKG